MFYLYLLLWTLLAFLGGCGGTLLFCFGQRQVDWVHPLATLAIFGLPAAGYWAGLVCCFFYLMGRAFRGG